MCTYHSTWFSRSKGTCTSNGGWFSQSCQVYRAWAWVTSWTLTKIAKWRRLAFERSYVIAIVHYVLTSFFVTYFIAPHYSRGWTFFDFPFMYSSGYVKTNIEWCYTSQPEQSNTSKGNQISCTRISSN